MKIDQIILNNFGSYQGENIFNTTVTKDKTIILVGGKNGAGKTTLLTAIRLCLYGYQSMGHKSMNSTYNKSIIKLINNNAKLQKPAKASVCVAISITNGQNIDKYELKRCWELDSALKESFEILKNGEFLSTEEIADFENYLLSLIPPELFNFYFFDGEKIADFFMNEGSNTRIKNAFLTLCGYDTFEIMRKNFKRVGTDKKSSSTVLEEYLATKDEFQKSQKELVDTETALDNCKDDIVTCDSEISELNKSYINNGGISQEEWDDLQNQLREEDKKREQYSIQLKKWANELIPFLMIKPQIESLKNQIIAENENLKVNNFCEIIDNIVGEDDFKGDQINTIEALREYVIKSYKKENDLILDLSFEKTASLLAQINSVLDFDESKIEKIKKDSKNSLNKSTRIRKKLDATNINGVQDYSVKKADLLEKKAELLELQVSLEQKLILSQVEVESQKQKFEKTKSELEAELKKTSINDISTKAIVMLDKLQETLYHKQIEKLEMFFKDEIKTLMRKSNFIDDISIDDDFAVHIYRKQEMNLGDLYNIFNTNTDVQVLSLLGKKAIRVLAQIAKTDNINTVVQFCKENSKMSTILPIEIDKMSLSSGEKQIFIMALYHSMVKLGNHEIPFIIDTPFARIDTEHRYNISKHFFSALKGQVFILSTNEEINTTHFKLLEEKIASTYMLENSDNKRTNIVSNAYFEV